MRRNVHLGSSDTRDVRTFRLVLLLVLVAMVTSVAPMASASAGMASYLAEQGPVQRSGFWGSPSTISDAQVLSIGYMACGLYARGLSDLQVLDEMVGYVPPPGSRARDVGIDGVRDARRHLCP